MKIIFTVKIFDKDNKEIYSCKIKKARDYSDKYMFKSCLKTLSKRNI